MLLMNRVLFPMYLTKWNAGFYANQLQIATGLHFLKKENTNTKIMVSVGCSRTVLKLLVTIKICIDQWQVIRTVLMDGVSNRYLHQWMVQKRNSHTLSTDMRHLLSFQVLTMLTLTKHVSHIIPTSIVAGPK